MESTRSIRTYHWEFLSGSFTIVAMFLISLSVPRYSWIWWAAAALSLFILAYLNVLWLKILNLASRN